jgi:hypothetical protein
MTSSRKHLDWSSTSSDRLLGMGPESVTRHDAEV